MFRPMDEDYMAEHSRIRLRSAGKGDDDQAMSFQFAALLFMDWA